MSRQAVDPFLSILNRRLDELLQQTPALAPVVAFYRAAIPLLRAARRQVAPLALDPAQAAQKLQRGIPLLVGETLPLDEEATTALWLKLCRLLEAEIPGTTLKSPRSLFTFFKRGTLDQATLLQHAATGDGTALRQVAAEQARRAVEQGQLDLGAVWTVLLGGDQLRLERLTSELKLDLPLIQTLSRQSLQPSLRAWAEPLQAQITDSWQHATCPLCGSAPALSEIQGKEGARRLRCGLCGAGWNYRRLACAFCNNRDHRRLGYLGLEGEDDKYRLQTCDLCRGYIKVVVTYDPIPVDLLVVEDLATQHLDVIAEEHGFVRMVAR